MVAKNTAIREFFIFAQRTQASAAMHNNTAKKKTMFLPNKNGENRHPNRSEITKFAPPASRQDQNCGKTYASQNRKSKTKSQRTHVCLFHFSLAGCKTLCFLKSAVATYQKPIVFTKKSPPPGKTVPYRSCSCLCHPDDHTLSTFGAGGFYTLILLPLSYLSHIPFLKLLHMIYVFRHVFGWLGGFVARGL